jgi:hypothetical protein
MHRSDRWLRGLVLVVAVAALATLVSSADAARRPVVAGAFVYTAPRNGADTELVLRAEGRERVLTRNRASDYAPAVSPDSRPSEIYVMNADGSGARRLTYSPGDDHRPRFSADGRQILFGAITERRVRVVPVAGGPAVVVARGQDPNWVAGA